MVRTTASTGAPSDIVEFYRGANVFLTGATGFLGKALLEKLFRTCEDVGNVYILVRPKKGSSPQQRADDIFKDPLFARLAEERPGLSRHIHAIPGDCALPGLGLSDGDRAILVKEVTIVFHGAATLRFQEEIRTSVAINVSGLKTILDMAKEMQNLKVLMYVSTAFSQCVRKNIAEEFYGMPFDVEKVLRFIEANDDPAIDDMTPSVIGSWPNTYTFTKAIAEEVVRREALAFAIPVGVFRPAIVISTAKEPFPGWTDNLNGPNGSLLGLGTGFLRAHIGVNNSRAELVPVDMTINALLAAAWDTAKSFEAAVKDVPVYNYVSSPENPITWGRLLIIALEGDRKALGFNSQLRPFLVPPRLFFVVHVLFHMLPALVSEAAGRITCSASSRRSLWRMYKSAYNRVRAFERFSTTEWNYRNDRIQNLWSRLCDRDRELFPFSMRELDWDAYIVHYMPGLRKHLLKNGQRKETSVTPWWLIFSTWILCALVPSIIYWAVC